jgi:hypothetical protein
MPCEWPRYEPEVRPLRRRCVARRAPPRSVLLTSSPPMHQLRDDFKRAAAEGTGTPTNAIRAGQDRSPTRRRRIYGSLALLGHHRDHPYLRNVTLGILLFCLVLFWRQSTSGSKSGISCPEIVTRGRSLLSRCWRLPQTGTLGWGATSAGRGDACQSINSPDGAAKSGNELRCWPRISLLHRAADSDFQTSDTFAISRRMSPEVCSELPYPLDQRAQGMPGPLHPRPRVHWYW